MITIECPHCLSMDAAKLREAAVANEARKAAREKREERRVRLDLTMITRRTAVSADLTEPGAHDIRCDVCGGAIRVFLQQAGMRGDTPVFHACSAPIDDMPVIIEGVE